MVLIGQRRSPRYCTGEMDKIMIDLNNPAFVSHLSPEAQWKRALITYFAKAFNLKTFVETGTCWGDTVEAVRQNFDDIWSVELSTIFFNRAVERFAHISNVHILFGSSGEILPSILSQIKSTPVIWLDAHLTGGPSAGNGDQVSAELNAIVKFRPDALVLIDDVKPNGEKFEAPDATVIIPDGWKTKFLSGVLVLHDGRYTIPEKF